MILFARRGTRQLGLEVLTDYRIRSVAAQYILQSFIPPVFSQWVLKLWSKLISWYLQILLITTPCPHGLQNPHYYKSFASDVDWGKDARQVETDRRRSVPSVPGRESDCVLRVQMCYWILRNCAPTFSHNIESTICHGVRVRGTISLSRKLAYCPHPSLY